MRVRITKSTSLCHQTKTSGVHLLSLLTAHVFTAQSHLEDLPSPVVVRLIQISVNRMK